MSGTLVIIGIDGEASAEHYAGRGSPPLETLQRLVGGYIEHVKVRYEGRARDCYVDEDGITKDLKANTAATKLLDREYLMAGNTLRGPCVIVVPDGKAKFSRRTA